MKSSKHNYKIFLSILLLTSIAFAQTFTDMSHLLSPDFPIGTRTGQRGASAADFNNDGLVDLYHSNFLDPGRLYLNQGQDGFSDILQKIDLDEGKNMWGAAFGDYNHDGYLDIIFEDLSAPSKLYLNNRNTTFTETNDSANVLVNILAQGAAWGDFNLDGKLDFFIVNDVGPNQLFKNLDLNTFLDISISANVQTTGNSYGVSWGDINNDGYPDAYIATCHSVDPLRSINHLLLNNGNETFTNIGHSAGVADSLAGWSVLMFDYDHDFDIDIFCTNSFHSPRPGFNRLYRNEGDTTFTNTSFPAGVAGGILEDSYGASEADFDNDGWTDIYITDLRHRDRLYHNNGDGTFIDISLAAGITDNEHRAVAVADLNNDGWIDIFTAGAPTNRVMFNNGGNNHWLKIRARGISNNYFGVDAQIEIHCDTLHQLKTIKAGDSFCSQNHDLSAHFGLGQFTTIDSMIIRWPGGTEDKFFDYQNIDQEITIIEGYGIGHRPTTFSLLYPEPEDTVSNISSGIDFRWTEAGDPDGDTLTYTIFFTRFDLSNNFQKDTVIGGILDTTFTLNNSFLKNNHFYLWSVDASDEFLRTACTNAGRFTILQSTGITNLNKRIPISFKLNQNYPNPFNPETNISYQIPLQSKVEIAIYNMLGEEIRVLVNDNQSAGSYTIVWDGKNREGFYVSSGIYIYRIKTEGFVKSKKMLLLK